jgi:hypothetical protein
MSNVTPLRHRVAAVSAALILSAAWIAGVMALTRVDSAETLQARHSVIKTASLLLDEAAARGNTIIVTAKRIKPIVMARLATLTITAPRVHELKPEQVAAIYIPPETAASGSAALAPGVLVRADTPVIAPRVAFA